MAFFNKKEDVLHIELTPLGRHLLSLGKLKPYSYKFFDDDIMYDENSGGISETQNQTHNRIIKDTPKLKHNGNINGTETDRNSVLIKGTFDGLFVGPEHRPLRRYYNKQVNEKYTKNIGTAKMDSDLAPNLKVDLFNGTIKNSKKFLETDINPKHIPQINIDVEYRVSVVPEDEAEEMPLITEYKKKYRSEAVDNKVLVTIPEIPLLRIVSEGDYDNKENFDIEAYKITINGDNEEYDQLKFIPQAQKIVHDILVDEPEQFTQNEDNVEDDYCEYFFAIVNDKDIPEEDYCETLGSLEVKNIYLDEVIRCPDKEIKNVSYNPYFSKVTEEDIEECDE
tara:strand:+ start:595 stop:1605 length:1011 start_codon:yes stop_codon:yes gene_type:complete